MLVGASRKRFLGALLPEGAADRASATCPTAVVSALAAQAGAWGVRVHDVRRARALALDVCDAHGRVDDRGMSTRDRITLTGLARSRAPRRLRLRARATARSSSIDVTVSLDLARAAAGDDLAHTVHYGELAEEVVAAVERDPVDLIETVAERVAAVVLGFPRRRARCGSRCTSRRRPSRCRSPMSRSRSSGARRMSRARPIIALIASARTSATARGHDRRGDRASIADTAGVRAARRLAALETAAIKPTASTARRPATSTASSSSQTVLEPHALLDR